MPITIFRSAHESEELNEKFKELFEECDILVVEWGDKEYWNKLKEHLNQLSQIGYSTHNFEADGEWEKLENFIKNSKKQIEVEESPVSFWDYMRAGDLLAESKYEFLTGKLEDACKFFSLYWKRMGEIIRKRDASLAEQLIRLQKENENKRILLKIGAGHLAHYELKKRGVAVKQEFPYLPYILLLAHELLRRIQFGKPYTIELVAQAIVEDTILDFRRNIHLPYREAAKKVRKIAEKLSYDEINDLSKYISKDTFYWIKLEDTIISWLEKKGYKIF
jgi:hypothetical protein